MSGKRLQNWDLLRSVSMFLVVVVHTANYLPSLSLPFDLASAVGQTALICDPVFFMLSGYFALRPQKDSIRKYYLKKAYSVVLPIFLYSVLLYLYSSWQSLSFGGYLAFSRTLFFGAWWFIPTLVSFLVIAPFLYIALEGLSDSWIIRLAKLLVVVYTWGFAVHIAAYIAGVVDRPGVDNLFAVLTAALPAAPIAGYLPAFCCGYLYRRLSAILSPRQKTCIAWSLLPVLLVNFVCSGIGVGKSDPDQLWVIASVCLFFVFEKVRIHNGVARVAIEWVAKRSYTVYLFQATTISIVADGVYANMLFGDLSFAPVHVLGGVWVMVTAVSYLLALGIASILDPLILNPTQQLIKRRLSI